jgi:hypothetical protein
VKERKEGGKEGREEKENSCHGEFDSQDQGT